MKKQGFTLIELLIVVAIIGILAAIAIPNFLAAQTRSKVAKTVEEMRIGATAMEIYRVDNNSFPSTCADNTWLVPHYTYTTAETRLLTTPVSLIKRVPHDCFKEKLQPNFPNLYFFVRNTGVPVGDPQRYRNTNSYVVASWGPDQKNQIGGWRPLSQIVANEAAGGGYSDGVRYDPTNGVVSLGDLYRFGPNTNTW